MEKWPAINVNRVHEVRLVAETYEEDGTRHMQP